MKQLRSYAFERGQGGLTSFNIITTLVFGKHLSITPSLPHRPVSSFFLMISCTPVYHKQLLPPYLKGMRRRGRSCLGSDALKLSIFFYRDFIA